MSILLSERASDAAPAATGSISAGQSMLPRADRCRSSAAASGLPIEAPYTSRYPAALTCARNRPSMPGEPQSTAQPAADRTGSAR